ncbi:MAG: polysaccharide biosynthesis/export family protein [Colwellia sp.]
MKTIISLFVVLVLSSCTSQKVIEQGNIVSNSYKVLSNASAYYIGVDDVLQINVWRNPDLSVTVPVRPDGKITVPLVGDIQAGGKVPMVVASDINKKLKKYIREPQVTVILTQLRSHEFVSRIRVTGAVQSPASLPYRQGMTVLDAVLQAGGLNEFASANGGRLFRKTSNSTEQYSIYLSDIFNSGELETNYELMPGDIISVPERLF